MIKAVTDVFGYNGLVHACFFHLTKSVWRNIQKKKLAKRYNEDEDTKHFCGMMNGLAFLPLDRVPEGMRYLDINCPSHLQELLNYFDQTYVRGKLRASTHPQTPSQGLTIHTTPPMFPPHLWNCHDATMDDGMRTNNFSEAWNNSFNHRLGKAHPSIWELVEHLKADNLDCETLINRYNNGLVIPVKKNKTSILLQEQYQRLCKRIADGQMSVGNFLNAIGHTISLRDVPITTGE